MCHRSARLHHQSTTTITVTWVLIQATCTSSAPIISALLKHTPHSSQLSDLAYTKWTLAAICYYLPDTHLKTTCLLFLSIVDPLCLHRLSTSIWTAILFSTVILGCVLLQVIHEFLARQDTPQYILSTSNQVSKSLLTYICFLPSAESINTLKLFNNPLCPVCFRNRRSDHRQSDSAWANRIPSRNSWIIFDGFSLLHFHQHR